MGRQKETKETKEGDKVKSEETELMNDTEEPDRGYWRDIGDVRDRGDRDDWRQRQGTHETGEGHRAGRDN